MTATDIKETADLINQVIAEVQEEPAPSNESEIQAPPESIFQLPGGYVGPDGYTATEVEIRELTGRDEEAISKTKTSSAMAETVLKRGLVRVGDREPDETILNNLLAGDRDFLMLKIFGATFGNEVYARRVCGSCGSDEEIVIDSEKDIPIKTLNSPEDRYLTVNCRAGEAKVTLPTGVTQKMIQDADGKTFAEMSTMLLANTVLSVGGRDVLGAGDVLDLPIKDRRAIAEAISDNAPGPQLQDVVIPCPSCDEPMEVPLTMAALFQF